MKAFKLKGSTSVILEVFIQDTSVTTGAGLAGLVFNTASLTCYYHRNTAAAAVQVSLVDMTVGTFTSSGFKVVDGTNMPGVYQLCLPDAAFATGADSVSVIMKGATNMAALPIEVRLDSVEEIWSKAMTELTAVPAITATTLGALNWVFTLARNKRTQTSATETVFKDDGSTSLSTSAKTDDGTTFTRGEYA